MKVNQELSPEDWLDGMERKLAGLNALRLLVEGPGAGNPDPVLDAKAWAHAAFDTYRSGMSDNHPGIHSLARIEHDFVAALGAFNFDDQARQLRQALATMHLFHHRIGRQ